MKEIFSVLCWASSSLLISVNKLSNFSVLEFPLELVYKYCSDNNLPSLNTQGNKKKLI